ncbi:phytanoyl-CoA dioxygenase [Parvibaculum sedimenti]|uniref:Phytanoyl-CoA dioxygenase n=1 Tax=Parvibaculum sedimenti TaxID=2608632 RepID=A0A6N6VGZ7_9HYPH|nr:phytanoyl-CoA dioxygenase family protein [Parvibaculum sedimenti]KAB7739205.1 phytanoyl-CoA dioxygenase [Parvibaculum sedimenti]
MHEKDLETHLNAIEKDGYTIVENAIDPDHLVALNAALLRLEYELGIEPARNGFEGHHTVRIYNLLAHGKAFERIPTHPLVLPIVEGVLDEGCLVSSLSSISIDPGERAQPIHADDQIMPVAKPHAPFVCNSMWALTDFTEENGATRIIPGSHKRSSSPDYGHEYDSIAAEMPKGSVLIWHGSLWHGGGANKSGERRVGIAMNYCAGYIRQQENQQLGLPLEFVRSFEPRLQELCGFGTYRSLIGHIDKKTPAQRLLGEVRDFKAIWDLG